MFGFVCCVQINTELLLSVFILQNVFVESKKNNFSASREEVYLSKDVLSLERLMTAACLHSKFSAF